MPDATPPPVSEGAVRPAPQALSREHIDAILADFRTWLEQLADSPVPPSDDSAGAAAAPDLHTLLAQFTALRHEVNLQTRSSRTQQEQTAEALRRLAEAQETLQRTRNEAADRQQSERDETLRPLLKSLVDAHDALALARREIQRVRDTVLPEMERMQELPRRLAEKAGESAPVTEPPMAEPVPSLWGRLFGKRPVATTVPSVALAVGNSLPGPNFREEIAGEQRETAERLGQAAERVRQMLAALLTGYTMSMQRLERAVQQSQLEAIPTTGQPFDPERMEAVEVVTEPDRTVTEVIEEVRRGYLWRGRVFRFAQVRVARPEAE